MNAITASQNGKFKITTQMIDSGAHGFKSGTPGYSIPKDTKQSMLAVYEKRGKEVPGPGQFNCELKWTASTAKWGGPKNISFRKTFCDEAARRSQQVPSPATYNVQTQAHPLLGKIK
jgi:hypothetical protein